jgi:hypothetical protein
MLSSWQLFKEKNAMATHLGAISVTMNEAVKLLSQLVKVCGDGKASSSVAQGSAVKFKADFVEELLKKLKSKQLVELYQDLVAYPELASYYISFLKNYLALLVHFQQHQTSQVSEKINKSLLIGSVTKKLTRSGTTLVLARKKRVNFTSIKGMLDT